MGLQAVAKPPPQPPVCPRGTVCVQQQQDRGSGSWRGEKEIACGALPRQAKCSQEAASSVFAFSSCFSSFPCILGLGGWWSSPAPSLTAQGCGWNAPGSRKDPSCRPPAVAVNSSAHQQEKGRGSAYPDPSTGPMPWSQPDLALQPPAPPEGAPCRSEPRSLDQSQVSAGAAGAPQGRDTTSPPGFPAGEGSGTAPSLLPRVRQSS